jgi:toxin ParE1/3/4
MPAGSPRYKVLLTPGAEQDLESIHDYIAEFDHPANAEHVLDELMKVVQRLARFPSAGATRRNSPRWASRTTARLRSSCTG